MYYLIPSKAPHLPSRNATFFSRWRPRPDDRAFPDTYIFTLAQLHAAGLSKPLIKETLLEFEQQLNDECQRELQELVQRTNTRATERETTMNKAMRKFRRNERLRLHRSALGREMFHHSQMVSFAKAFHAWLYFPRTRASVASNFTLRQGIFKQELMLRKVEDDHREHVRRAGAGGAGPHSRSFHQSGCRGARKSNLHEVIVETPVPLCCYGDDGVGNPVFHTRQG